MSKYLIKIAEAEHGVISAHHEGLDQQYCESGETVIIKNQPDAGWGLQALSYTTDGVNYTAITDGTFTMPASNIIIVAVFKRFVIGDWTEGTDPNTGMPFVSGENGQPVTATSGTANERPTLTSADAGYLYFDTTLKKWIVWNGGYWTDMAGRPTEPRYLKFTAETAGAQVGFVYWSEDYTIVDMGKNLQYSIDGGITWNDYTFGLGENNVNYITLANIGDSVLFRGNNENMAYYSSDDDDYLYTKCLITGQVAASGDVTAMLNAWGGDVELASNCYSYMFRGCTGLTAAPELPATTLASDCYNSMFYGCTGLTTAPELPATTLASDCYSYMFYGCTGLTTAPELPATTLASDCYNSMFSGCTGLTSAPELPATTLAGSCYGSMFSGCTGLTTAPELPATTLASYCYSYMFYGCTGLTTAPELPATTLAGSCYGSMFSGCTGLTAAPELPATTLANGCYSNMFQGCTNLAYIKAMFTTTPSTTYTNNWVNGVAASGTFVKNSAATWNVTGNNGVPSGWTVETADA